MRVADLVDLIAERCEMRLGFMPTVRKPASSGESDLPGRLDYSVAKLLGTGFVLESDVVNAIDETLFFCANHFHRHA
jgi:hypothetical protein